MSDCNTYRLHVEELMRFKRYLFLHAHVWPALPDRATAILTLPNGQTLRAPVENCGDHSVVIIEEIAPAPDMPVHTATLRVETRQGVVGLGSLDRAIPRDQWSDFCVRFQDRMRGLRQASVLELGSRTRGDTQFVARQELFADPSIDYVGLDIVNGPNVDVVGDVHRLSAYFPANHFDLVYGNWVFEHLMSPWQAVIEINKVLRPGGELMINTNHSIGLHDLPWDFFRFSASSWVGLLNEYTGFEIVETALGGPVRITPMRYDDSFKDHEGGLGHQISSVIARKTGDPQVSWPVDTSRLLATLSRAYPVEITD